VEESNFRESKNHWMELWLQGISFALGIIAVSHLFDSLWIRLPSLYCRLILTLLCLLISAVGAYFYHLHHYEKQKKADDAQGRKRETIQEA